MNQYAVKSENGKLYGPFKDLKRASKWAHVALRRGWGQQDNWSVVRLFKP